MPQSSLYNGVVKRKHMLVHGRLQKAGILLRLSIVSL